MRKILLLALGALIALQALARDFTYEYEGQTLSYTVINEEAKTCQLKRVNNIIAHLLSRLLQKTEIPNTP